MPLVERMDRKLQGWSARALSFGGRLTLINSSLSATPIYFLSFFKAPDWVICKIDRLRRNFLWAGTAGKSHFALVNWKAACSPREVGGLGILDLRNFNIALLAKWWWIRAFTPESRIAVILRQKYGPRNGIIFGRDRNVSKISSFYRGIKAVRDIVRLGFSFKIGRGKVVSFWEDRWCGTTSLKNIFPALAAKAPDINTSVFSSRRGNRWWIRLAGPLSTADRRNKERLRSYLLSNFRLWEQDEPAWLWDKSGKFSVRSLFAIISDRGLRCRAAPLIWTTTAPLKVRCFCWLVNKKAILTWDNLRKRGWVGPSLCPLCRHHEEDVNHILRTCPVSNYLWDVVKQWFGVGWVPGEVSSCWGTWRVGSVRRNLRGAWDTVVAALLWSIWRERNNIIFREHICTTNRILARVIHYVDAWTGAARRLEGQTLPNMTLPPTISDSPSEESADG